MRYSPKVFLHMSDRFKMAHGVWPLLMGAARQRRTLTYGDLAMHLGLRGARPVRATLVASPHRLDRALARLKQELDALAHTCGLQCAA